MTSIGLKYEAFRPQFGRMRLCGIHWDVYDRLLDIAKDPSSQALGAACESLSRQLSTARPKEAAMLCHFAQFQETQNLGRKRRLQAAAREGFWNTGPEWANGLNVSGFEFNDGPRRFPGILVEKKSVSSTSKPLILINGLDSAKEVELWAFCVAVHSCRCRALCSDRRPRAR